jgi:uroporphyrinogen-III synthase
MGQGKARAWYVISLRPQSGHAALRRAAARVGAGVIALSPWSLVAREDDEARQAWEAARACEVVVFTSPAAVRFAHALAPIGAGPGQILIGTGSGTRAALARLGLAALAPSRMDSEGLLDLPALATLARRPVGLVTAPQGRGTLAPALQARGARLHLAEVYQRQPVPLSARAIARLDALQAPACVLVTSGGALREVFERLPARSAATLRAQPAIVASARLAGLALQAGFERVLQAEGPRPAQLLATAQAMYSHRLG